MRLDAKFCIWHLHAKFCFTLSAAKNSQFFFSFRTSLPKTPIFERVQKPFYIMRTSLWRHLWNPPNLTGSHSCFRRSFCRNRRAATTSHSGSDPLPHGSYLPRPKDGDDPPTCCPLRTKTSQSCRSLSPSATATTTTVLLPTHRPFDVEPPQNAESEAPGVAARVHERSLCGQCQQRGQLLLA